MNVITQTSVVLVLLLLQMALHSHIHEAKAKHRTDVELMFSYFIYFTGGIHQATLFSVLSPFKA